MSYLVNETIKGIANKLYNLFGGSYKIYSENIKQELKNPCFNIVTLSVGRRDLVGERYIYEQSFDIHFFPRKLGCRDEMLEIRDTLLHNLRFIKLLDDSYLYGTNIRGEIVEDVLHIFVNYDSIIVDVKKVNEYMGNLEINGGIKNGG